VADGPKSVKRPRSPTIKDVAALAGVSIGTVSAVVREKTTVNSDIRKKVKRAIEKIGYSPNAIAQSMRLGSSRTIGIVVRDISVPSVGSAANAAQDVFSEAGYTTFLASFGERRDRQINLINAFRQRKVDGLLVAHQPEDDTELHALLKSVSIPLVLLERELPDWADSVLVNHRAAIRRATEFLIQLGHRRIAILVGDVRLFPTRERLIGFEEAHSTLGVKLDPTLKKTEAFTPDYGFRQTILMTESAAPPTAIIAAGPLLSGVLRALAAKKIRIPKDISLVATSNSDLAELTTPSISTERWDTSAVGSTAAHLLLEHISQREQPHEPKRIMLPAEFSVRDSCARPKVIPK
jgi:LacI family transcriptional regulator